MRESDTFDLRSHDTVHSARRKLVEVFPEVATERGKIDLDRLRQTLGDAIDVGKERYTFSWPGKSGCFSTIQAPTLATLRPRLSESLDFEIAEHVVIDGDSLEVLKLLQKSYLGRIKMIYIDPPYNTGSDFIYPDDYSESLNTYLRYTGQIDADGKKFGTNTEASGRFHSKWLNMMYPRLYLARNLLRDEGVIFISIDDHELHNLRRICDEIFGEDNFICTFVWEKRYAPPPDTKEVGYVHENILLYRRSSSFRMGLLPMREDQRSRYKNPDNDPRGPWKPMDYTSRWSKSERPNLYYRIVNPNTHKAVWPKQTRVWAFSPDVHKKNEQEKRIWWGNTGKAKVPALKNFLSEIRQGMMPMTLLKHEVVGNTDEATKELREIIPDIKYTPKPVRLIKHLATIANVVSSDIVLDFFSGSGTTAQAILELNREDGAHRKFILVQLPEPTESTRFPTVTDIGKERIRRVIARIKDTRDVAGHRVPSLGVRIFSLAESNFQPWNADSLKDAEELVRQLELHANHIRDDRTTEDLLYEILLKSGFPLTTSVERLKLAGKVVYSIAGGAMLICLERELTLEAIRATAEYKPERVVCLDQGFAGNDSLKANAVQLFKTKGITSFKTV
jgi:adenine-specific DNA-methyltransferase